MLGFEIIVMAVSMARNLLAMVLDMKKLLDNLEKEKLLCYYINTSIEIVSLYWL